MGKFLLDHFSHITLSLEILAAVTGLILYNKYKGTVAKYFIYFLVYTVVMVVIGGYASYVKDNGFLSFLDGTLLEKNYWWFTIFWTIAGPAFYGWYFSKILKNKLHKKILKLSVVSFIITSTLIILLNMQLFFTNSIPLISVLGALIILLCVFYFFMEILKVIKY